MVKRNIIVNLIGRGIALSLSVVLVPIYLHLLGSAALGLIGFYGSLYTLLAVVEQSIGTMLVVEMARLSHAPDGLEVQRRLMRTTEIFYLLIALLIGVLITATAPIIVKTWLSSAVLSYNTLVACVTLMGWAISIQIGFSLHVSALNGLEQQIKSNLLSILFASARGIAALAVLFLISATTEGYFASQVFAGVFSVAVSFFVVWRWMPGRGSAAKVEPSLLVKSLHYTPALTGAAIVFVILLQSDKLIISALLPLEALGPYVLASMLGGLLFSVYGSIGTALVPRFARLLAQEAEQEIRRLFHAASQFVALAILPATMVAVVYPTSLIFLWTGDIAIAATAAPYLQLLTLGSTLICLTCGSNSLQLAAGSPQFGLYANLTSLAAVPLAYFATMRFGPVGATLIWLVLGTSQLIIPPLFLRRRLLRGDFARWYLIDLGIPCVAVAAVGALSYVLVTIPQSRGGIGLWLLFFWTVASLVIVAVCRDLREVAFRLARQMADRVSTKPVKEASPGNRNG